MQRRRSNIHRFQRVVRLERQVNDERDSDERFVRRNEPLHRRRRRVSAAQCDSLLPEAHAPVYGGHHHQDQEAAEEAPPPPPPPPPQSSPKSAAQSRQEEEGGRQNQRGSEPREEQEEHEEA